MRTYLKIMIGGGLAAMIVILTAMAVWRSSAAPPAPMTECMLGTADLGGFVDIPGVCKPRHQLHFGRG